MGSRRTRTAVFVAGLLALAAAPSVAAPERPVSCFGHAATMVGTPGRDVLVGGRGRDVINAREGNDVVRGRGGWDLVCGGQGNDFVDGGPGSDRARGGRGDDHIQIFDGVSGNDFAHCGPDQDGAALDVYGPDRDQARRCETLVG